MAIKSEALEYIKNAGYVEIITNGLDGYPNARLFGHHANAGYDVYLSTTAGSQKTRELKENNKIAAVYRKEGQPVAAFYSVTLYGTAEPLERDSHDFKKAVTLISAKSETFRDRVAGQGTETLVLYKVTGERAKVLDFSKGRGRAAVEEFGIR